MPPKVTIPNSQAQHTAPQYCVLLDSGAFSAWNSGVSISIDDYIAFCQEHPDCNYYVNLDVIPGSRGKSISKLEIDEACKQSWNNYQIMCKELPKDKVIPVFHFAEDIDWLRRYIDDGSQYIGIGSGAKKSPARKREWLFRSSFTRPSIEKIIRDSGVRTHGFGVTTVSIMRDFPWYSVDSTSWAIIAAMGNILIPRKRNGEWDYSSNPIQINVSDRSPSIKKDSHLSNLRNQTKEWLYEYLRQEGIGLGKSEIRDANGSVPKKGEQWENDTKQRIVRTLKKGITTCHWRRRWINMLYFQRFNEVSDLSMLFLAENATHPKIEKHIRYRLMSYADLRNSKALTKAFQFHCNRSKSCE